ncbi:helix-turn-helix domain-containing protein [Streptomyces sp. NPDC020125]|uniref:ArsR/SmtB family transcription factor n=1 Tax=Streptomyces sp. NPDC020125 TaxID=3154593 RepID=UPI0033C48315
MTRESDGPAVAQLDLGAVLSALADPHRRRIVTELVTAPEDIERSCSSFQAPVSKSTMTHHFKVLADSGLIRTTDYGNRKGVTLRRTDLNTRFPGLLALLASEATP